MECVRWGIVGCGDVTEVKSGPGFQKANASKLVAVMRRDVDKAADYAKRHGVPRHYGQAEALIEDAGVDAVYVATPPSSHLDLALKVAQAGKPCLVEKPMAMSHSECRQMAAAFRNTGTAAFCGILQAGAASIPARSGIAPGRSNRRVEFGTHYALRSARPG